MTKKRNLWNILLASPFILAVLTCFIVNFALDRQFSWSLLTAASCLYAYLMLYTLIFGGKHRILFTYLVLAILLIPFLYIIEYTANLYLPQPIYWTTRLGIPVSLAWLAALAVTALLKTLTHANGFLSTPQSAAPTTGLMPSSAPMTPGASPTTTPSSTSQPPLSSYYWASSPPP